MGAVIVGLRPGDHKDLDQLAELVGRPAKEVAGILLEQAIRRERGSTLEDSCSAVLTTDPRGTGTAA